MVSIKALSNISHDGQDYAAGDSLEVTNAQAAVLIEGGVASKGRQAIEGEVVTSTAPKPLTKAELIAEAEAEGLVLDVTIDNKRDEIVEAIKAAKIAA